MHTYTHTHTSVTDEEDELQPLHHAALNGHAEVVLFLLTHGSDVNVTDAYGRTVCVGVSVCVGKRERAEVVLFLSMMDLM